MRIDTVFVGLGLTALLAGTLFGAWMGALEKFQFANAHAHLNLLGFVTGTLYGLIHRTYPSLRDSRLAWPQFVLHFLGVAIFVPGLVLVDRTGNASLVVPGGAAVIVAVLLFLYIFLSRAGRAVAA